MHSICDELVRSGHECIWWTANFSHHTKSYRSEGWKDIDVKPNYKIRLVPTPAYYQHVSIARLKFHLTWSWRIYKRGVGEPRPDCIIVNDAPLGDSYFALLLAQKFNAKLILDITDQWPEHFLLAFPSQLRGLVNFAFGPLYAIRRYVRRRADAISALCEGYFDVVRRELSGAKRIPLLTVFNGVDVAAFRKVLNEPSEITELGLNKTSNEVWVVYAGTIGRTYDIAAILEAARLLEKRQLPVRFIVAGDGPLRPDVERLAQRQGARLNYLGRLKPQELIQIYKMCDIGLCAYGLDSTVAMPDKVYDYMVAGLPIINSLRGELENLLRDRRIGIQYKAGDPDSLVDALEYLAGDESHRKQMAWDSYDIAMQFDRHVQYQKFVDLVESLLSDAEQ